MDAEITVVGTTVVAGTAVAAEAVGTVVTTAADVITVAVLAAEDAAMTGDGMDGSAAEVAAVMAAAGITGAGEVPADGTEIPEKRFRMDSRKDMKPDSAMDSGKDGIRTTDLEDPGKEVDREEDLVFREM